LFGKEGIVVVVGDGREMVHKDDYVVYLYGMASTCDIYPWYIFPEFHSRISLSPVSHVCLADITRSPDHQTTGDV
jgi:hypothetical protein